MRQLVILRPRASNLDGADPVRQLCAAFQRPAIGQPIKQCAAEGVAATCGVDHRGGWNARARLLAPDRIGNGSGLCPDAREVTAGRALSSGLALAQGQKMVI